jgi:hypothetical protein
MGPTSLSRNLTMLLRLGIIFLGIIKIAVCKIAMLSLGLLNCEVPMVNREYEVVFLASLYLDYRPPYMRTCYKLPEFTV